MADKISSGKNPSMTQLDNKQRPQGDEEIIEGST
jgi:hypothetical protein